MTDFSQIQRNLVNTLLRIPRMATFEGRTTLLNNLPNANVTRSEAIAQQDLIQIIRDLRMLGRLNDQGGARPLIIVVDNALDAVTPTGEVAAALNEVRQELEQFYGGEVQPPSPNLPPPDPEALIFGLQRDTRLPFAFIERARRVGRSIARLSVPRIFNGVRRRSEVMYGTGWLIAPGWLITNYHVIDARIAENQEDPAQPDDFQAQAEQVIAWFDYHREGDRQYLECRGANLMASDRQLDYALIRLAEANKVTDRSPPRIVAQQPLLVRGDRLNIVQHSHGGPLQYAIRNNFYVQPGPSTPYIRYQTDTEPGASGSPVCDDEWQVVALHHANVKAPVQQVPQEVVDGKPVTVNILNQAIVIHSILNNLSDALKRCIMDAQPKD